MKKMRANRHTKKEIPIVITKYENNPVIKPSDVNPSLEGQGVFTGFISDDELDILLNQASMLIYPSLYEGFGIPILEAMRAGTPVITSNLTAMPEVAGDAGLLIDPLSVDDMAAAMSRLLKDDALRTDLISKGKNRAAGFSWDKNWNGYLALYKETLNKQILK